MNQLTPEGIRNFFEQAVKANTDAWTAQAGYFDEMVKRNTKCFTALADARITRFREMSEAKTFNQAFEANLAFEETLRDELGRLQDNNVKAWEALTANLKSIYTPAVTGAKKVSPIKPPASRPAARKAAPKPRKAALKKAAPKKAAARASVKKAAPKAKAEKAA